MPRRLLALSCAVLAIAQPTLAAAQAKPGGADLETYTNTSRSNGASLRLNNSNQDARSSDLCWYAGPGNAFTGQLGCWAGYDGRLVIGRNAMGVVNARQYPGVQVVGRFAGENNAFDAVAYNGWQQVALERFDVANGRFVPVGPYEGTGAYCFTAYDGTSTNCNAGLSGFTTETQVHGSHEGAGAHLFFTPNGSTGLLPGLTLNAGGKGGVSIGSTNIRIPADVPADLGNGTINAASDIATGGHFEAIAARAPKATACGARPGVTGADQAAYVQNGASVTACTIAFGAPWKNAAGGPSTPVCQVQLYNSTATTVVLSSKSSTAISVSFGSGYAGVWSYICMGIG